MNINSECSAHYLYVHMLCSATVTDDGESEATGGSCDVFSFFPVSCMNISFMSLTCTYSLIRM